jgi:tetratricopeptide (TPR) repeat protein
MPHGTSRGTIVRASAVSFLGEFRGEVIAEALIKALGDPNVVIQAEAARALSEVQSPPSVEPLKEQLSNPVRIVRLNAVFALIKMGILELHDSHAAAYQKARQEYVDFLTEFPTVFETRVDLGTFLAVQGKYEEALAEYKNARKLRPESPLAHYYIGVTYAQLGLFDEALASFDEVLKIDPSFRNTRDLIRQIQELKSRP